MDLFAITLKPILNFIFTNIYDLLSSFAQILYRHSAGLLRPVVDFTFQKIFIPLLKRLAPQLQQKELLKKLAYPFVSGFAHIQNYLLPNWFLTKVERFIRNMFGHREDSTILTKDKDTALVVVVSFFFALELLVIAFGYLVKLFYLFVFWWEENVSVGRILLPHFASLFLENVYLSLQEDCSDGDCGGSSGSISGFRSSEIFVWWPDILHHELGAAMCIVIVLTSTSVLFVYALCLICIRMSKVLRKLWRKKKSKAD